MHHYYQNHYDELYIDRIRHCQQSIDHIVHFQYHIDVEDLTNQREISRMKNKKRFYLF